jgi:hypothetical protein
MPSFTSPSGKVYKWTKSTPPTQEDIDAIVAFDSKKEAPSTGMGNLKVAEERIGQPSLGMGNLKMAERDMAAKESVFGETLGNMQSLGPTGPMVTPRSIPGTPEYEAESRGIGQAAAGASRIGLPVAAGFATGGMGLLPAAAILGTSGVVGEELAQGVELATGNRDEMNQRAVVEAGVRSAVPGLRVAGPVRGALANFGAQAGANLAASSIGNEGLPTTKQGLIDVATAIPSGVAGGFAGAVTLKGNKAMQQAAASREAIERQTGQKLPALVGEQLQDIGILRGELRSIDSLSATAQTPTAEGIEFGRRAVLLAASGAKDTGAGADDIARDAIMALERNIGPLNKKARESVTALAKDYEAGKLGTLDDIQAEIKALTPGASGETRVSVGRAVRETAPKKLEEWKAETGVAFDKLRKSPVYTDESIGGTQNVMAWKRELEPMAIARETPETPSGILDEFGRPVNEGATKLGPIPSALPEGTQKYLAQIEQMAPNQSIEQLRNWRTRIMDSVSDDTVLPGMGDRMKIRLAQAIGRDIEASLSRAVDGAPVGPMRQLLKDTKAANKIYSDRVDDFDSVLASGILRDEGTRGARSAESISDALTGKSAVSTIEGLKKIYGKDSGPIVDRVKALMRDEIMQGVTDSVTGEISVGKLLSQISNDARVPRELVPDLFPNADALRAVAKRELAAKGLPSTDTAVSQLLSGDADFAKELSASMSAPRGKSTLETATKAIKAKAAEETALRSQVMRAIRSKDGEALVKNPADLVRQIAAGAYDSKDVGAAMSIIRSESPVAANNLEFLYVENLLREFSGGGTLNARKLAEVLGEAGKGTAGGTMTATAEAVLGKNRVASMRNTAKNIVSAEAPREAIAQTMNKAPQTTRDVLLGALVGAGSSAALGQSPSVIGLSILLGGGGGTAARPVIRLTDRARYSLASRLIADGRLDRLTNVAYDSQRAANALRLAAIAVSLDDPSLESEMKQFDQK